MKLYHGTTSVCSIKVRLCLAELGLQYDSEVVDLQAGEQHAPHYLALNPEGVVPTLVDEGLVIVESSLIVEYLDRNYNGGRLMPQGRAGEARARLWLLRCLDIHAAVNTITFATIGRERIVGSKSAQEIEAALNKMPNPLARMKRGDLIANGLHSDHVGDAILRFRRTFVEMAGDLKQHEWISGALFGISDIALVPYVDRLERLGFEGIWRTSPVISDWLMRMQGRQSYITEVQDKLGPSSSGTTRADGLRYWPEVERRFLSSD